LCFLTCMHCCLWILSQVRRACMCGLELVEIGQILCPQAGTLQVAKRRQRVRHTTKESWFFFAWRLHGTCWVVVLGDKGRVSSRTLFLLSKWFHFWSKNSVWNHTFVVLSEHLEHMSGNFHHSNYSWLVLVISRENAKVSWLPFWVTNPSKLPPWFL
jgi:hypothetical protein